MQGEGQGKGGGSQRQPEVKVVFALLHIHVGLYQAPAERNRSAILDRGHEEGHAED
jgi:hypothetical protein